MSTKDAPVRFRCLRCEGLVPVLTAAASTCPICQHAYPVEDGIVALTPPQSDDDYPEALVNLVAAVEGRHFWFAARNDVILSTLGRTMGSLSGVRALDVGCGTGLVLAALESAGAVASGIDMHHEALAHARRRVRGPLFRSSVAALPFAADFDLVTLFDVIEHVDDDVAVLREASRVLSPGGYVGVTVPAGPNLWTRYDEVIGHKRRYDRASLTAACTRAGLRVREMSYFNGLPALAQRLQRLGQRQSPDGDTLDVVRHALKVPPAPVNAILRFLVRCEAPFRRAAWIRGGSLIVVGQPA